MLKSWSRLLLLVTPRQWAISSDVANCATHEAQPSATSEATAATSEATSATSEATSITEPHTIDPTIGTTEATSTAIT